MEGMLWPATAPAPTFQGFGPSDYLGEEPRLHLLDAALDQREMRQRIRDLCPPSPGVYGMLDSQEQLIYVGTSGRLRDRLLTYFTGGDYDGTKERRIAGHARRVVWEMGIPEFSAPLRELELIRRWRPRFNRRGRLESDRCGYLCLTGDEAPHFRAARRPPRGSRRCWGPIRTGRMLRAAIDRLNQVFQLRDCSREIPVRLADQRTLFDQDPQPGCLRGSLATCSAPCAAGCTRGEYRRQIDRAAAFLDGQNRDVLEQLETAMREASQGREYERAVIHRDALRELTYLFDQLQLLREVARDYWFVYPVPTGAGRCLWNLVAGGDVVAVMPQPGSGPEAEALVALLAATYARRNGQLHLTVESLARVQLVVSWFRQHPEERGRVISPDQAANCCTSGAKERPR